MVDRDGHPQLAQQARGAWWWLRAMRRRPGLAGLLVVDLAAGPALWAAWHPAEWLHLLVTLVVVSPIGWLIRDVRLGQARKLEHADEAAERTGRRRPLDLPTGEQPAAVLSWRSPTGLVLLAPAAIFPVLAAVSAVLLGAGLAVQPPHRAGDRLMAAALVGGMVILPAALAVRVFTRIRRSVQALRAARGPRTVVDVLGIESATQHWILERQDTRARVPVKVIVGRRRLVAGDTLFVDGLLPRSSRSRHSKGHVLLALTGQSGTLWARLP